MDSRLYYPFQEPGTMNMDGKGEEIRNRDPLPDLLCRKGIRGVKLSFNTDHISSMVALKRWLLYERMQMGKNDITPN